MATKPALLVEVETDGGLIGLGEAAHFGGPLASTRTVIEGELRDHLLGEDPREIERLWERMHQRAYKHARAGLLIAAMSGIDIALWDLRGKMIFPAHPLMGDLAREPLLVDTTGHLELSDRPGLGVELDPRVVAKYRADRSSGRLQRCAHFLTVSTYAH